MRWLSGAASVVRVVEKARPSRCEMMQMPWSPRVPETSTLSPGLQLRPDRLTPAGTRPTPAVLMNTPSAWPRSTTFVSPVTMDTPASAAVCAIVRTIWRSLSMG